MPKYLILTMLLFSLSVLTAGDYIIGTGTSNQNYVPLNGNYNYNWSKFFFMAVITMAGAGSFSRRMNYWLPE